MTALPIDLADDAEELIADYIDGRIAMQRLADPTDPMISSAELLRSLLENC
ncbi:MAG TPA: hypothetical protein VLC46_02045 [Thermoanaerobaculia bacterium]|jgi:hypothetical protein|nr:hypothetical protein [Thermoanaerobaculia bacterium]